MKKINIGWSLGYPQGFNTSDYKAVIEYAINHGTNKFRLYELHCKGFTNDTIVDLVQLLSWYGKAEVLLCESNIPFEWMVDYDLNTLTPDQMRASAFTNRFMPKPLQAYGDMIKDLVKKLEAKGLLKYVSWEVGNEPDASNFFWGTFEEYQELARLRYEALKASGRPVYVGDFTSSLMRDKTYKGKQKWMDYIETDPIFNEVGFSHSFYWYDSSGLKFDPAKNSYPARKFSDIIVSEYNIYVSFKSGSEKEKIFNSVQYVKYFCDMLRFFYDKPVSTIYIHTLFKFNKDSSGSLGHYDGKIPKPAALMFWKLFDVIKVDGYTLLDNGIKGAIQSIVFDEKGMYTIVKN